MRHPHRLLFLLIHLQIVINLRWVSFYKRKPISNLSLFANESKGTIGGEGAAFFLLSDEPSTDSLAELNGVKTFYKPAENTIIEKQITNFLAGHSLTMNDID